MRQVFEFEWDNDKPITCQDVADALAKAIRETTFIVTIPNDTADAYMGEHDDNDD